MILDYDDKPFIQTFKALNDILTNEPLGLPECNNSVTLKRKLSVAFGESVEKAHKLMTMMISQKHGHLHKITQLLTLVKKACGYCLAVGHMNPRVHFGSDCPSMSPEMQLGYKSFRTNMVYPNDFKTSKPCYFCHICSMGDDKLHPEFVSGGSKYCPNPNMVVPLAFAVYHQGKLQKAASQHFQLEKTKISWQSLIDFRNWLVQEDDIFSTKGMALLAWYADY